MPEYTCWGSVRRGCGHRHRSVKAAVLCRRRDQRACRRTGGYSDRVVVRVEGFARYHLSQAEMAEADAVK